MSPVSLRAEPAFCLHWQRYGEAGAIADFLLPEQGRLRAVVHGVYKAKSRFKPLLQAFVPLQVQWQDTGRELERLRDLEALGKPLLRCQSRYLSGLYLNELVRTLFSEPGEGAELIFQAYATSLQALDSAKHQGQVLRRFELCLLATLGYQPPFDWLLDGVQRLDPERYYGFRADRGVFPHGQHCPGSVSVLGAALLNLARAEPSSGAFAVAERDLMRHVIDFHTGGQGFHARQLSISQYLARAQAKPESD